MSYLVAFGHQAYKLFGEWCGVCHARTVKGRKKLDVHRARSYNMQNHNSSFPRKKSVDFPTYVWTLSLDQLGVRGNTLVEGIWGDQRFRAMFPWRQPEKGSCLGEPPCLQQKSRRRRLGGAPEGRSNQSLLDLQKASLNHLVRSWMRNRGPRSRPLKKGVQRGLVKARHKGSQPKESKSPSLTGEHG